MNTETALAQLTEPEDILLADVAIRIQLRQTHYDMATERYQKISKLIERGDSPLKDRVDLFYPQGSMAIGATIASKLKTDEFDIDVVAQLGLPESVLPREPLDLLFEAIRGEPGSRYYRMTKRRTRCVTVNYSDKMHIDITPLIRRQYTRERESWIFHDRPEAPQESSKKFIANPYGFAEWFKANTPPDQDFAGIFEKRAAEYDQQMLVVAADSEPVPPHEPPFRKSKAVIVLQLLKRWRNVQYDTRQGRRPPSILIAKLIADAANHTDRLSEELLYQAQHMLSVFQKCHSAGKHIHAANPMCSRDILTDRWPETLQDQEVFIRDLEKLVTKIKRLVSGCALDEMQEIMVGLFGEVPTTETFRVFNERIGQGIRDGHSQHHPGKGGLIIPASTANTTSLSGTRATRKHTLLEQRELGQKLKRAREATGLTQQQVADSVALTRVAISQIESGQRAVRSFELLHLSRLYGRDMVSFFDEKARMRKAANALTVLFRAHPELVQNPACREALQQADEIFREYLNLKALLDLDTEQNLPPVYACPEPRNVWEAIQMGERAAEAERSRLALGHDPIRDMAELVEAQGIPVIEINLDDQISGIFIANAEAQLCVFINQSQLDRAKARVSFTIAHEYSHILLDRDKVGAISKISNERDLFEVRANAFAAAFLMPQEGVSQFLKNTGKGSASREKLLAYTERADPLVGHHRRLASSQIITLYDVVKLCAYFGTSFEAALYRLRNTKFLSEESFAQLCQQKEEARQIARFLNFEKNEPAEGERGTCFALNFTGMAIEAYRRDKITYNKLLALAGQVAFGPDAIDQVLSCMGLENHVEEEVYLPE